MRRIRIVYKIKPRSFAEKIERKAKTMISSGYRRDAIGSATATVIRREIALTLSQLNHLRNLHQNLELDRIRQECYLETEIIQREPRVHVYFDPRLPERDRLRDRLRAIGKERRRFALIQEEDVRKLQDKLVALLSEFEGGLNMQDGSRQTRRQA